jgi:hypothetical protein
LSGQIIVAELEALSASRGIRACALVDSGSGLVWHACGREQADPSVWEAASEYWRLHRRLSTHFTVLGELGAAVMHHTGGVLVLLPCEFAEDMLVACMAEHKDVDWQDWQWRVRGLGEQVKTK